MSSRFATAASEVAPGISRPSTGRLRTPSVRSSPRDAPHSGFSLLVRRMRSRNSRSIFRPPCPMSGFPAPESFEPRAMPPKDGFRLHHLGQIKQIWPDPRDPHQQCAVATVQPQTRRRLPQGDVELMTEKQILGFEPASRLEHVGDEHSEPMQDHKHRSE
jgi:hypothetical protein